MLEAPWFFDYILAPLATAIGLINIGLVMWENTPAGQYDEKEIVRKYGATVSWLFFVKGAALYLWALCAFEITLMILNSIRQ